MLATEIIAKKRDGLELSAEELEELSGDTPEEKYRIIRPRPG